LDSGDVLHSEFLGFGQVEYFLVGFSLDIEFFFEYIGFEGEVGGELGVGHAREFVVVGHFLGSTLSHAYGDRFGTKEYAIEVIVALGEVGHDELHLVDLVVDKSELGLELVFLADELFLAG